MRLVALLFLGIYGVIGGRLVFLGFRPDPANLRRAAAEAVAAARPDLLDRNGEILATDVKTMSVFAEPRRLIDKDEATELLTAALPQVDARELRERLASKKGFVWVKREVTPHQRDEVFHLGLPGVGLIAENKRVYPNGPIGAHVLGFANVDNIGIAGMEKYRRRAGARRSSRRRLQHDAGGAVADHALARHQGDARAARRTGEGRRALQGAGGRRRRSWT